MSQAIMDLVEKTSLKENPPEFEIGDTVDVHLKMFSVRRIVAGEGVERKFPVHSPRIEKIEVKRSGVVRRAKLYFLRDRVGKAVRLKERRRT